MYPAPQLGHVGFVLPPDAIATPSPAAAVLLPSHHRPTVGVNRPENQNDKGLSSSTTPTAVFITMTTSTTTPPIPTSAPVSIMSPDNDNAECRLLGSFALFVQLALGGLALLSLVFKRWRERPQRPIKVWWFDVSKQVVGSVLVHMANVFMSMLTSGRFSIKLAPPASSAVVVAARMATELVGRAGGNDYTPNPCSMYLLNLAIDTTLGIPILIMLLRIYTSLVAHTPLGKPRESIKSGNYGRPPKATWWLKQSFIYFCGLFGMKICVLVIFLMFPWISQVGDWALRWTEGNEKLQIIFVMMLFPLIMNAMQYYIIDSFIKAKDEAGEEDERSAGGESGRGGAVYEGVPGGSSSDGEGEDEGLIGDGGDDEVVPKKKSTKKNKVRSTVRPVRRDSKDREYDPAVDGDSQTVIGSSSSPSPKNGKGRTIPTELYPKE